MNVGGCFVVFVFVNVFEVGSVAAEEGVFFVGCGGDYLSWNYNVVCACHDGWSWIVGKGRRCDDYDRCRFLGGKEREEKRRAIVVYALKNY